MKKFFSASFLLSAVLTVIFAFPGYAYSQWHPACQEGSLPSHDPKYPADQLIITCIPPNWNGQLVLYAHGYVPPQFPLALPVDELTVDGTFVPNILLAQGFAFATTSFHKNGVAIEQGGEDLNKLLQYFKSLVPPGSLGKVYLVGGSEGGLIALRLFERFQGKYDGVVALCAPLGGSADFIKYAYDFRVVFDYFFPTVFTFPPNQPGEQSFGAIDVPQAAFQFWESVYVPRIIAALSGNPLATAQLFSVTKAAIDPSDPTSVVETAVLLLSYGIFGANDLIATSGGVPYDNRSTTYVGSADDAALNAGVERIQSDGRARAYAKRFYEPIGNLHDPLVTLHNVLDPLVPFQQEIEYQALVTKKKKSSFLTVLPVARYGHCDFTAGEVIDAFSMMIQQAGGQLLN
jgi:pimeloyl-ACP methyl ester carboxylesterase